MKDKFSSEALIAIWFSIASENKWIGTATDPVFSMGSFTQCHTTEELKANLIPPIPPPVGQAYYLNNTCFINQFPDLPCWLILKNDLIIDHNSFEISRRLNVVDQQLYYYLNIANRNTSQINPAYHI